MAVMLGLVVLLGLLSFGIVALPKRPTDPLFLSLVVFGMFYGLRAVLVGTGLDDLSPDYLFATSDESALVASALFNLNLFLLAFLVAAWAVSRRTASGAGLLFMPRAPTPRALNTAVGVLTALTLIITASLIVRYGGVSPFMAAVKLDKALAGQYVFKLPAVLGAFVSAAALIDVLRDQTRASSRGIGVLLGCAVFNALCVFAWGQRSVVAAVLAMIVLGSISVRTQQSSHPTRLIGRILLACLLVVSASFALRIVRDASLHSEGPGTSFASATAWRQLSVSVNGVYFDASVLAFRDWPTLYSYRGGDDFRDGILGTIPRAVYPDKPQPLTGQAFRQVYEPEITNGWPAGTPAIWYLNFGLPGVLAGGLLSGAVIGHFARRSWAAPPSGMNVAVSLIGSVYVLQLGLSSETPFRAILWIVPLLPILWALRGADSGTPADGPATRDVPSTPRAIQQRPSRSGA